MIINIGENIRRCRTELHLTQEQLVIDLPSFVCGRELMTAHLYEGERQMECYQFLLSQFIGQINKYLKKLTTLPKGTNHWSDFINGTKEMNTCLQKIQENQTDIHS